jgi:hypothetical protein
MSKNQGLKKTGRGGMHAPKRMFAPSSIHEQTPKSVCFQLWEKEGAN